MLVKNKYQKIAIFSALLIIIYCLAWHLQKKLLLNADVSWLMEATRRLLAGGTYQRDFFELNPPLILYLYMPAVVMTKLFNWSEAFSLRLYVFGLSFISLSFCFYLSKRIFNPHDQFLRSIFLLITASLFWIFPIYEFGQREILLLILSFPYFMLMASRLYQHVVNKFVGYSIGIMAGIGFAIKPFFLTAFLLTEAYYAYKQRNLRVWKRPEVKSIVAVMLLYGVLLFTLHRDYLTVIAPFINQFYYQDYKSPLWVIFFNDQAIYFYFSLSLLALFYNKMVYKQLATVLMLAATGFYLSYLLQSTYWYYHVLPMFALSVAIFALIYFSFATNTQFTKRDYVKLTGWLILFAGYLATKVNYISLGINFYPASYFCLYLAVFAPLLYLAYQGRHLYKLIISLIVLFAVNFIFYKNVQMSIWFKHVFLLANTLLLLSFILVLPSNWKIKIRYGYFALVGLLLFSYPFYWTAYLYQSSLEFKRLYLNLVREMKVFPGNSLYFFTDSDQFPFPALNYTRQPLASRFASLGGMPILTDKTNLPAYLAAYEKNKTRLNVFIDAIVDDFQTKKPDLIFVDVREPNHLNHLHYFGNTQIDYVQLFSLNPAFKRQWQHYQFVKTIDGQPLYKFNIFKRVNVL